MSATSLKILNAGDKLFTHARVVGTGTIDATTEDLVADDVTYPLHSEYWDNTAKRLYRRIATANAVADWAYVGGVRNNVSVAFAGTITIANSAIANFAETHVVIGALTNDLTALAITNDATKQRVGDKLFIHVTASGADRTITYSTGFATIAATLVVTSAKVAVLQFVWNGTTWVQINNADTV